MICRRREDSFWGSSKCRSHTLHSCHDRSCSVHRRTRWRWHHRGLNRSGLWRLGEGLGPGWQSRSLLFFVHTCPANAVRLLIPPSACHRMVNRGWLKCCHCHNIIFSCRRRPPWHRRRRKFMFWAASTTTTGRSAKW